MDVRTLSLKLAVGRSFLNVLWRDGERDQMELFVYRRTFFELSQAPPEFDMEMAN